MRGATLTAEPEPTAAGGPTPLAPEFVVLVAGAQRSLYAYIRSLVGPWAEPDDILQEVNLVLCRKAHEFTGTGRFLTWACRIAYLQVLAHLKHRRRDRSRYVDESLLADLAGPLGEQVEQLDDRVEPLRRCLGRLSPVHRRMITARYAEGGSVETVAKAEGRPPGLVRVTLHRVRLLLLGCIERTLTEAPRG